MVDQELVISPIGKLSVLFWDLKYERKSGFHLDLKYEQNFILFVVTGTKN